MTLNENIKSGAARQNNIEAYGTYLRFRSDIIAVIVLGEQLVEDSRIFDNNTTRDGTSLDVNYAIQSVDCILESFDRAVALFIIPMVMIQDTMQDDPGRFENLVREKAVEKPTLDASIREISARGRVRVYFGAIRTHPPSYPAYSAW